MPERFVRRRAVEVVWSKTRSVNDGPRESIRVRRNRGPWEEVASTDDLPPDLQGLLDGFGSDGGVSAGPAEPELPPRRKRRRKTIETSDELRLEYVWFAWSRLFRTLILAGAAFYVAAEWLEGSNPFRRVLGGLAAAAGVYAVYWTLAVLLNRSTFVVRRGRLTVCHRPLPLLFNRGLDDQEVTQLYVDVMPRTRSRGIRYDLRVLTASGDTVTLLDDVRSKAEAIRLEHAIERHLGIADRPELGA